MSSTCFEQPSVHPREDLYMQFYGISVTHPCQAVCSMAGCVWHFLFLRYITMQVSKNVKFLLLAPWLVPCIFILRMAAVICVETAGRLYSHAQAINEWLCLDWVKFWLLREDIGNGALFGWTAAVFASADWWQLYRTARCASADCKQPRMLSVWL
jgi:hypothetical protein